MRSQISLSRQQLAVVVSGIVSMGLEILAGRVLAPEFGSSIYTWGSIIGISMLALSLGYHHGGKRAKNTTSKELDRFLILTSFYVIFLIVAGEFILSITASIPISPRYAAIIPVSVLFGPPTYFLGYISPYAVQLSSKDVKGEASGHFYAVGTAGSIIGAFATTFILIPGMKVSHIYMLFAALTLLPVIRSLTDRRILVLPIILLAGLAASQPSIIGENVVSTDRTPYQDLRVEDENGVRTLYLDDQPQSAMYTDNRTGYPWDYPRYFHLPFLMRDEIDEVLFIGGGGFTGPQIFARQNITVDAVEIDPGVIDAAENYFNLAESENLKVYNQDGRQFLEQSNQTYDVIYLDAYRKSQVPFHLTTKEFMELAHEKTDEDGIVFSNLISAAEGPSSRFVRAEYRTLNSVYQTVYYFPTEPSRPKKVQNVEIIASKQPRLSEQQLKQNNRNYTEMNLSGEISNLEKAEVETSDVPLLRDNYAPVERLIDPLVGREYVLE